MAPEQVRGLRDQIGPATDIFSLGAILYELLTGRAPFAAATTGEVFARLITEDPLSPRRLVPGLSRDLETICLKCLEKEPKKRYAGAQQLADDLQCYLTGKPITARPLGLVGRTWRWCRRQPLTAASLAIAGLLTVALIVTIVVYEDQLAKAARQQAEDERELIVQLEIRLGRQELGEGFACRALLWFADAWQHDEGHSEHETAVREDVRAALRQVPDLIEMRTFNHPVIESRISKDAAWVVTASPDGTVRIFDIISGTQVGHDMKHDSAIARARLEPEGVMLTTQTNKGDIREWNVATGRHIPGPSSIPRLPAPVEHTLLSKYGHHVLTVRGKQSRVWNTATGAPLTACLCEDGEATHARIAEDGQRFLVVESGRTVRLWRLPESHQDQARWTTLRASDLILFVQVLTGQRVDEHGSLQPVPPEEVRRGWLRWRRLQAAPSSSGNSN
jgi:hypothetical protein